VEREAELDAVGLAGPDHFFKASFLLFRKRLPPAVDEGVETREHRGVAVHQKIHLEPDKIGDFLQVLLGCPGPAFGPPQREPGPRLIRRGCGKQSGGLRELDFEVGHKVKPRQKAVVGKQDLADFKREGSGLLAALLCALHL
jgi:hypothetical protein